MQEDPEPADLRRTSADLLIPAPAIVVGETIPRPREWGPSTEVVALVEERLAVTKRRRVGGRVRLTTRTEVRVEEAKALLDRNSVTVSRVPIGQIVESLPPVRNEGDITIIPVVEERLVVVKQLVLVEELHIRQEVTREAFRQPVELRRQVVDIERLGPDGRPLEPLDGASGLKLDTSAVRPASGTGSYEAASVAGEPRTSGGEMDPRTPDPDRR